jgi:DnaK suppressor protein
MATPKATAKSISTGKKSTSTNPISVTLHGLSPYVEKKNEEYMNDNQREHFKAILKAWRLELMEEVDRTVTHMKDEAANFPDPADRATQEEEFSLELRTRDRERKLIKKIDKTLIRVEDDDYGFCDQCGIEVGIRRLEARPTADLCVDCKTLDEIKEKQLTGG